MKNILTLFFCFSVIAGNAQTDTLRSQPAILVNTDSVYEKPDIIAQFPGGEKKWNQYIQKEIEKNIINIIDDHKSKGVCTLQFIVDRDGSISNVKVLTLEGSRIAKLATKALLKGNKWIPATVNGVAVKSIRVQTVTFQTR